MNQYVCKHIDSIEVTNLTVNVGHQRAISVGLSSIVSDQYTSVIVMDCDGEDKVSDIKNLIEMSQKTNEIVVARRKSRSETTLFKVFYFFYKLIFRILTGRKINFSE